MIAIAVKRNNINSAIDDCFGKCEYFFLYDKTENSFMFIDNPAKKVKNKKGLKAASYLIKTGVKTVISGNFGIPVKKLFDKHKVQMVMASNKYKTLKDIKWIHSSSGNNTITTN